MNPILKYFSWDHLPGHLQAVSKPIGELALAIDLQLPDCAEKSAGLRKLLEAKDCLVRAGMDGVLSAPNPIEASVSNQKGEPSPVEPYQSRAAVEKAELDLRIFKLAAFFATTTFDGLAEGERIRLRAQHNAMTDYSRILGERIAAFTTNA